MDWLYSPDDPLLITLAGCLAIFILVILITRIIGLRSFAKFTNYDFAFTVAIGSIISSTLTSATSVAQGFMAIAGLLVITYTFSTLQRKSALLNKAISNKPLQLMEGDQILHENLKKARVQEDQLIAKLREANVINFNQVITVVLESTGDISVLHRPSEEGDSFDPRLLQGVSKGD